MRNFFDLLALTLPIVLFVSQIPKFSCYQTENNLIVTLKYPKGRIRGHELTSAQGRNFYAFQDVPYAAPPVGKLRYKEPTRHSGWKGVLNATGNRIVCVQPTTTFLNQSEDCLFVNVYTPVRPGSKNKLPVYVWIHGGGFAVWDGVISRYGPQYLIDFDIVVVTLNYRLWALGFLATDDGVIPGNLGLRDQNMALQWVQQNIHLFGGDPQKVTIGGESAGSTSVSYHLLSKKSKGLFRGAIQESGSAINIFAQVVSPSIYSFQMGKLINGSLDLKNTTQLLHVLQNASVSEILNASLQISPVDNGGLIIIDLIFAPTYEGSNVSDPFISEPMHQSFIEGHFFQVPTLIGINSEEVLWFLPTSKADISFKISNWPEFYEKAAGLDKNIQQLVNYKLGVSETNRLKVANVLKKFYTNSTFYNDSYAYVKVSTDFYFGHGTIRQAETTSTYVPVYLYVFDYTAEKLSQFPGTQHTEELQYMWKANEDVDTNEFQSTLRNRMCLLWTNFIKYGNPTPVNDEQLGNITWPMVRPNNVTYLNIGKSITIGKNPRLYKEVKDVLLKYLKEPLYVY